ncbi:MAG: hypothetical protein EOP84_31175, partial [Verrucomicrobiaceae bacterium]
MARRFLPWSVPSWKLIEMQHGCICLAFTGSWIMKNLMRLLRVLAFTLLAGFAPAYAADKVRVSSFSTILTEVAQQVGGDRVEVIAHVKPGVDPHEYEPKPADLKAVSQS